MTKLNDASIRSAGKSYWLWLVPILAVTLTVYIVWQNLPPAGEEVVLLFSDARGISPNQTQVRYRGVTVGRVTGVTLSEDSQQAEVHTRIQETVLPLLGEEALFWLVEPVVNVDGIKGIETIISGSYITFESGSGELQRRFTALEHAPIRKKDGLLFKIKSQQRYGISPGASLYYKQVPVGIIYGYELASSHVMFLAQVYEPYKDLLRKNSVFWERSGFELDASLLGVSVSSAPLASFLSGGINFATPAVPGEKISNNQVEFELAEDGKDEWEKWEPDIKLPVEIVSQELDRDGL